MISLVFFGTGPVASESLKLLAQEFKIEAVVTKPRPSHHKAHFPVLKAASELGLKTLTAATKAELTRLINSTRFSSSLGVVIDFGIILPRVDFLPLGLINSHFSLLPEWRGADPITFAVLSGQKRTGVSLMLISEGLDEGPLLAQAPYDLPTAITTPKLTEDLILLSDQMLKHILPLYVAGRTQPAPQEEVTMAESKLPTYSRKLAKNDGVLDWHKPAARLEREIRAFLDWPRSRTRLSGKDVIVTQAHVKAGNGKPGTLFLEAGILGVYTAQDILVIDKLIPSGKKEMAAAAFLAGHKLK